MRPLFIHIPKTGGSSIKRALNIRYGGHYKSSQLRESNTDVFSFAFVRNPWDRFVSAYFYLTSGRGNSFDTEFGDYIKSLGNFNDFILKIENKFEPDFKNLKKLDNWLHFIPQTFWLDKQVDFIGKFENLQDDFNYVCSKLNIKTTNLSIINRSLHQNYTKYYDNDTKNIIGQIYKNDIEIFNYKFNG